MKGKKKQQFQEGDIVKIPLLNGRLAFGRLLPGVMSKISVFDFVVDNENNLPSIETIISNPILFYCAIYKDIIAKGIFEIMGNKLLTAKEVQNIPPTFTQDLVNINDCTLFWDNGNERNATPKECIGLERSSVWDHMSLVQRIEDFYAGRKNIHVELNKVILSKDDPRYLPPPNVLRWDFEKHEFYRTDR